jgi:hypothetical protein
LKQPQHKHGPLASPAGRLALAFLSGVGITLLLVSILLPSVASLPPGQSTPALGPTLSTANAAVTSNQPTVQAQAALDVWAVSGMERIGRDDPPGNTRQIELFAARGEYEPFQVAVRAPGAALTNVNLRVSDLRGADDARIASEHITLYREHYVYVRHASPDMGGSNKPLGVGWYADALIPFKVPEYQQAAGEAEFAAVPIDVEAQSNQPFWIDIFVPRDAAPGEYAGTYTVTSDQGQVEGRIKLTVWDFTLPIKPSLVTGFDLEVAESLGSVKELLAHRIMPQRVDPANERELIDEWGLGATNLRGFWSGANIDNCEMEDPPAVEDVREAVALHQSDLLIYNYTADEIDRCPELHDDLRRWAERLQAGAAINLVTMMPTEELQPEAGEAPPIDIYVVLAKRYIEAPDQVARAREQGSQIWSYNAGVQDGYSPKWQIDFAPINFRIQPGFLSQSMGFSGLFYWQVDRWTNDPWRDIHTYSNGKYLYPGEGMLVYPGEQVGIEGIVPSMRLKWLREGVEDYEYMALLKAQGQETLAMEAAQRIGGDWKTWSQDVELLAKVRRELGEALSN